MFTQKPIPRQTTSEKHNKDALNCHPHMGNLTPQATRPLPRRDDGEKAGSSRGNKSHPRDVLFLAPLEAAEQARMQQKVSESNSPVGYPAPSSTSSFLLGVAATKAAEDKVSNLSGASEEQFTLANAIATFTDDCEELQATQRADEGAPIALTPLSSSVPKSDGAANNIYDDLRQLMFQVGTTLDLMVNELKEESCGPMPNLQRFLTQRADAVVERYHPMTEDKTYCAQLLWCYIADINTIMRAQWPAIIIDSRSSFAQEFAQWETLNKTGSLFFFMSRLHIPPYDYELLSQGTQSFDFPVHVLENGESSSNADPLKRQLAALWRLLNNKSFLIPHPVRWNELSPDADPAEQKTRLIGGLYWIVFTLGAHMLRHMREQLLTWKDKPEEQLDSPASSFPATAGSVDVSQAVPDSYRQELDLRNHLAQNHEEVLRHALHHNECQMFNGVSDILNIVARLRIIDKINVPSPLLERMETIFTTLIQGMHLTEEDRASVLANVSFMLQGSLPERSPQPIPGATSSSVLSVAVNTADLVCAVPALGVLDLTKRN